jgi:hypothetical protein
VGGILLVALAAISSIWAWPLWRKRISHENDYAAYVTVKNLAQAESDFYSNDRDRNGIQDFWTADVTGLYSVDPGNGPISLIDRRVAEADARPLKGLVSKPIPYHGYYFLALDADERENPPEPYPQDTDKKSGKVHHLRKFGFCAYPAGPETGNRVWIIDENNTAFMSSFGMITPPKNWPKDFRRSWSPQ